MKKYIAVYDGHRKGISPQNVLEQNGVVVVQEAVPLEGYELRLCGPAFSAGPIAFPDEERKIIVDVLEVDEDVYEAFQVAMESLKIFKLITVEVSDYKCLMWIGKETLYEFMNQRIKDGDLLAWIARKGKGTGRILSISKKSAPEEDGDSEKGAEKPKKESTKESKKEDIDALRDLKPGDFDIQ